MRCWTVAALLAMAVCAHADDVAGDRRALLSGVEAVVAPGGIPGDFAVFGDGAFVVLTGRMGHVRLPVMAAARGGRARVVAVGHEGFFNGAALRRADNARLAVNIATWASGRTGGAVRIGLLDQDPALRAALDAAGIHVTSLTVDALAPALDGIDALWLNQASLDGAAHRALRQAVLRWMRGGGGLVVTGPAWGWQSLNPARDLARDQSGNALLAPLGIQFAPGMLDPSGRDGFESGGVAPDEAHSGRALAALEAHAEGRSPLSGPALEQAAGVLTEAVGALPAGSAFARRVRALCRDRAGDVVPTRRTPITTAMPFARLQAVLDREAMRRGPATHVTPHPSAASFPGAVPVDVKREVETIAVDTRVPDWHGTGLYAAPGETITVTVSAAAAGKGLGIRIGAHTDTLWHLDRWERFPEVSLRRELAAPVTRLASPFGGTLYVEAPEGATLGTVSVTIAGAVRQPRYVRGVTTADAWRQTLRSAPAPWAELEGRLVILTVPSTAVRDIDDPGPLMAYWDEVMEHCYALYAAPLRARPERYCVDRQISAGYMHSGYPIMTGDDVAATFCNVELLRRRDAPIWGFYHEMGHNFQQPEWTWEEWGEVTNNLFSLYGAETINGKAAGAHPAMTDTEIEKRIAVVAGAPGRERFYARDPWYPLTMLLLLRRAFGWEPFTTLFREFRDMPAAERPKTEAERHDQFLERLSRLTGHDLGPYLSDWGVELSDDARAKAAAYPAWMPATWPRHPSAAVK